MSEQKLNTALVTTLIGLALFWAVLISWLVGGWK